MRYERPRQGDAIAAPIHRWFDREDGNFEGFGGQSWDQVDGWSNRTNAGLAPVKEGIRHSQPVRAAYPGYRVRQKMAPLPGMPRTSTPILFTEPIGVP